MANWIKISLIVALLAIIPIGLLTISYVKNGATDSRAQLAYKKVEWRGLKGLNVENGQKSPELAALDGQQVKIPGFIVPLDDNASTMTEFLLVPSPQACIHVPPPPANQMVLVRMASDVAPKRTYNPIWIRGRLQIVTTNSPFGQVGFVLYGESTEVYESDP